MRLDSVLDRAVDEIVAHPFFYLGIALLVGLPDLFLTEVETELGDGWSTVSVSYQEPVALWVVQLLVLPLALTVLTVGALRAGRELPTVSAETWWRALRLWPATLGLCLAYGLGVAAGTLLCVLPGLVLLYRWLLALPVLVAEETGVARALARSWRLMAPGLPGLLLTACVILVFAFLEVGWFVSGLPRTERLLMESPWLLLRQLFWVVAVVCGATLYRRLAESEAVPRDSDPTPEAEPIRR